MISFVHRCKQGMPRTHVRAIFQLSPHSRACHTLPIAAAAPNSRVLVVRETLQRALHRYKPPFSQHSSCRTSHSHLDCKQRIACCVRKQTAHSVTAVTATQHAVQFAAASHSCGTALILKLLMLRSLAQQIHCSLHACNQLCEAMSGWAVFVRAIRTLPYEFRRCCCRLRSAHGNARTPFAVQCIFALQA